MALFGICGHSGAGKTTLIEALLPILNAQGLTVNVVKHSHHDIELEPQRKDSARFRSAGAQEVLLATPYRYAIMHELANETEPGLATLLARLAPADVTLVEGYTSIAMPRLIVHRAAQGRQPRGLGEPGVVAIACDRPDSHIDGTNLPRLPLDDPQRIAVLILHTLHR
ncbi:Molybdopterin-guanine dinucleotide biosynthesis adapter protein [Andreprevotia sp. IGB-42]|uniref:molybdopterin-guanine dinucleotide biosynthesis protein B n=1 Tax=Andreprevotia sp. IGB-42 TaxID=2497473 RepID=UPI00135AF205|nr:molybdopterin-guanine dinucleotide biosynthesis protein B [Andreprevotia sp. IGB-42]KAF0815380.1 Molybdopterin-guanine dinucleotide biosynthesis adapter protein [Andreprevotia sp. IGB-42]